MAFSLLNLKEKIRQYFNPESNGGNNFWSSNFAKGMANAQQSVNYRATNTPRIEIPQIKTGAPVLDFGLNLAKAVPESLINIPRNYAVGIARTGIEAGTAMREKRPINIRNFATSAAPLVESIFDVATMGLTTPVKQLGKEAIKGVAKQGAKQLIKRGAITGAGFGGFGGLTYGLDQQYGQPDTPENFVKLLKNIGAGMALGGTIGGGVSATGALYGKIRNAVQKVFGNNASEVEIKKITDQFVRDELGRFAGRRIKEPVYYGDLRESLGMPRNGYDAKDVPLGLGVKEKVAKARLYDVPANQKALLEEATKRGYKDKNPLANIWDVKTDLQQEQGQFQKVASELIKKYEGLVSEGKIKPSKNQGLLDIMSASDKKLYSDALKTSDNASALLKTEYVAQQQPLSVPKELEPLAQEARKYKSAEELQKTVSKIAQKKKDWILSHGGYMTKFDEDSFVKTLSKGEYSLYEAGKDLPQSTKLTDFYNQATKGVTEVKTDIPPKTEPGKNTLIEKGQVAPATKAKLSPSLGQDIQTSTNIITPKGKINVKNLKLSKEGKRLIQKSEKDVVPTVIGNKEVIEQAKLVKESRNAMSDESMKKVLATQLKNRQAVIDTTKEFMKAKRAGATPQELAKLMGEIADRSKIARQGGTFAGRILQAQNILADESATPMQKVLALLDNAGIDKKKYMKDAVNVDWENGTSVVSFYRKYVPAKLGDILTEIRYTNMLSSPLTHIINTFSNILNTGVVAPVEKTITGTIGKVAGIEGASPLAGARYLKGYVQSLPSAFKKFKNVLSGNEISIKPDMERIPVGKGGAYKAYTTPLRALEASDQFFKELVGGGVANELKGTKISTTDLAKKISQEADYRLFRQAFDPDGKLGQGYLLRVWDKYNSAINGLRQLPGGNWIVPFLRTPTNILKQGVEYSPLGALTIPGSSNKIEQLSKTIVGTTVFAGIYSAVNTDNITWSVPTNQKERDLFYASGKQPYSIKIGNNWYSYQKLGPLSYPIAMAAALKNAEKYNPDQNMIENISNGMGGFMQFFADQSYVKQLGDFIDAVQTNSINKFGSAISAQASNVVSQLIPYRAFLGWVARTVDPVYRKANGFVEKIQSGIPVASMGLEPYTDLQGQPSKRDFPIINALSPVKVSREKPEISDMLKQVENKNIQQRRQKQIDLDFTLPELKKTGSEVLDKELLSDYKGELTKLKNNVIEAWEAGAITQEEAIKQLEKITAAKNSTKKGSKAKKISIKRIANRKVSINIAKSKIKTMPMIKSPKVKILKAKKLKV